MNIIEKLIEQKKELRVSIDVEKDFIDVYEDLELIRIYFELLDGNDSPCPIRVPGTTPNLFGKNFFPSEPLNAKERIETEVRINIVLCLYPHLVREQANAYEQPFSPFRLTIESIRMQIERWLVLHEQSYADFDKATNSNQRVASR